MRSAGGHYGRSHFVLPPAYREQKPPALRQFHAADVLYAGAAGSTAAPPNDRATGDCSTGGAPAPPRGNQSAQRELPCAARRNTRSGDWGLPPQAGLITYVLRDEARVAPVISALRVDGLCQPASYTPPIQVEASMSDFVPAGSLEVTQPGLAIVPPRLYARQGGGGTCDEP